MSKHLTTGEILEKARDLISEPEAWCQFAYAVDASGVQVPVCDPEAVAWDMLGAIDAVSGLTNTLPAEFTLSKAASELDMSLHMNDDEDATHEQVMAIFDRAIEIARKAEAA